MKPEPYSRCITEQIIVPTQARHGEVLAKDIGAVDSTLRTIERDTILNKLTTRGIIDMCDSSIERAESVLLWADHLMEPFVDYEDILGAPIATSLAHYMRENTMTTEEYGQAYSNEVKRRTAIFVDWCMREQLPRINAQADVMFERLCDEGVDKVNARWQANQYKTQQLATLETTVIRCERKKIRVEAMEVLPAHEQLPTLERRYAQLDALYAFFQDKQREGVPLALTPLPFKTIICTILPPFNPNDTSPRSLPNKGKDIDVLYFDNAYISALTGRDGFTPIPYYKTHYAELYAQAEKIGDFGLALWPLEHGIDLESHCINNSSADIAMTADVPAGIVWSLLKIAAVRRGEESIDEDIKLVLPATVSSCVYGASSLLLSLYRTNKGSMQPTRFGVAFDMLPQHYDNSLLPKLECAHWRAQ